MTQVTISGPGITLEVRASWPDIQFLKKRKKNRASTIQQFKHKGRKLNTDRKGKYNQADGLTRFTRKKKKST